MLTSSPSVTCGGYGDARATIIPSAMTAIPARGNAIGNTS